MSSVNSVLVVGGGVAGCATAILLAQAGVEVHLIDIRADLTIHGSGISLQGNALRVLRDIGVWEQVEATGYPFDSLGLRAPDATGSLLVEFPDTRTGGSDLPASLGIPRAALARILLDRADDVGVKIGLATTHRSLRQDSDGVDVALTDGSAGRYDVVVAADGIRSATRTAIGIELETTPTGMGIWRAFTRRPSSVTRTDLYYGGPCYIAGYCPTGEDSLYAYLVEDARDVSALTPSQRLEVMRGLAGAYHGPWDDIREVLVDSATVHYSVFETHVLHGDWHRGRVVFAGDAVHSCPPTLAQGAAQALEDAAVLAELLISADRVDDAVLTAYRDRRFGRAKAVVDASNQLGQWLLDREQGDVAGLIARISALVEVPA